MGKRICFYLPDKQCEWIREMSAINRRSQSYFVELALDKLIELTGGYGDGEES